MKRNLDHCSVKNECDPQSAGVLEEPTATAAVSGAAALAGIVLITGLACFLRRTTISRGENAVPAVQDLALATSTVAEPEVKADVIGSSELTKKKKKRGKRKTKNGQRH